MKYHFHTNNKIQKNWGKRASGFCLLLAFSIWGISCNNETPKNAELQLEDTEHPGEETHEEETPTVVALTPEQIAAVGIELGKVEQKELTATIRANGMLKVPYTHQANATSLYGGAVKTLNVQIGDDVSRGQVVATITNPQFIQMQEEYLTIGNKIVFAEQELQRQQMLNAGNAGALKNLQSAKAALSTLRTRKSSLHRQIKLMGINPNTITNDNLKSVLTVRSPLNGTVSQVFARIGSYVDVSAPVAEIVDNSSLHLDLQVFEKDLMKLRVGQTIHFTLTNNPVKEYDAKVFSIGSSFENESKTIAVHCNVTGDKTGLIDGMNITGVVSLSEVTSPAVPNEAIISSEGKDYIFLVTDKAPEEHHEKEPETHNDEREADAQGHEKEAVKFERIEVLKGVSNMGYTAVTFLKPVAEDEQIVVKGAYFINAKLSDSGGHHH